MAKEETHGQSTTDCSQQVKPGNLTVSEHKCDLIAQNQMAGTFVAGRVAHFIDKWRELTSDKWVLDTVQHYHIEFAKWPFQSHIPKGIKFSDQESAIITDEVVKMLQKGAIT